MMDIIILWFFFFFWENIYLLESVLVGPLLLFQAQLFLNYVQHWLHYLNKIQNLGVRPEESSKNDWRLRNIASEKRLKKLGQFGLEKRNWRGSINSSQIPGEIWQSRLCAPVQCVLGDGQSISAAEWTDRHTGGFSCPCLLSSPFDLGFMVSEVCAWDNAVGMGPSTLGRR